MFFDFLKLEEQCGRDSFGLSWFLTVPSSADEKAAAWKILLKAQMQSVWDWMDQLRSMPVASVSKAIPDYLRCPEFMNEQLWRLGQKLALDLSI